MRTALFAGAFALLLSGCAGVNVFRSHDSEMSVTMASAMSGQVDQALATLESNNKLSGKDFLYFLEKGELLRLKGDFEQSRDTWLQADEFVRQWEERTRLEAAATNILEQIGSVLINDKVRSYEGQDYEKVTLAARLALNHAVLNDWESARVEVRKMHEREGVIAEFRAKEVEALKEKAAEKEITTQVEDLEGYPIETLNSPEVTKLRNSYQSAFGHYLAGFIYEVLNEPGLAAAGYRQAIELRPDVPMLKQGLAGLDRRIKRRSHKLTDTLIVVESGRAPAMQSVSVPLPAPTAHGLLVVPVSFPTIGEPFTGVTPKAIRIGRRTHKFAEVTSFDAMARRALKDDLPSIIIRSTLRAAAKGAVQHAASKSDSPIALVVAIAAGLITESADERIWRSLPANIAIARVSLEPGRHKAEFVTSAGTREIEFDVQGPYSIVTLRTGETGNVFLAQATTPAIEAPRRAAARKRVTAKRAAPPKQAPRTAARAKSAHSAAGPTRAAASNATAP